MPKNKNDPTKQYADEWLNEMYLKIRFVPPRRRKFFREFVELVIEEPIPDRELEHKISLLPPAKRSAVEKFLDTL